MRKLSFFTRSKRAFTLIEMITVMAIMTIAAALVVPNLRGVITKTEETKYKNYCMEAAAYVRSHTNLLTLGEDKIAYEDAKSGEIKYYDITTPTGLTGALNEYNLEETFQYYVLAFEGSSATNNPTSDVQRLLKGQDDRDKKDVMITVITTKKTGRVPTYTLQGFWYYSLEKEQIVLYYYAPSRLYGTLKPGEFRPLTKSGK